MDNPFIVEEIRKRAVPFDQNDDLDYIIEAVGDARIVLLGESSHGTSEFYKVRMELSKRLIEQKGFSFIAVEGDWPSCYSLNRFVKNRSESDDVSRIMHDFNRWPTWMWANTEMAELAKWMRSHNSKSDKRNLGFYGLDVYSLWESMEEVVRYLDRTDSPEAEAAKKAFACFEPFQRDSQTYGVSAAYLSESCENEVVALLSQIQARRKFLHQDDEASVSLEINTMVAANAERYYRSMVRGGPDSWNIRDHHMVAALEKLLQFYGPTGKAIVWEHNTHIGDARATDMAEEGMVNVGQLLRERYNRQVFAIGFGTHRGTVVAAKEWGDPLKRMIVPPAQHDSWEGVMHRAGDSNKILLLGSENPYFQKVIGHRAIGVVYHPEYEHMGNYVPSNMAQRYDAFIFIDRTTALHPLIVEEVFV